MIEFLHKENGGWWHIIHSISPAKCWRRGTKEQITDYHKRGYLSRADKKPAFGFTVKKC